MSVLVFHAENTRDSFFFGHDDIYSKADLRKAWVEHGYTLIASVETDDLDRAYMLTQNIESSWLKGEKVDYVYDEVSKERGGARSLSVGDVLLMGEEYFVVANCGFEKISLPLPI